MVFFTVIRESINLGTAFLFGSTGETITEKSGHLNLGIPGIPRLRCPDFSVIVSPVEPNKKAVPRLIDSLITVKSTISVFPLLLFLFVKHQTVLNKELATDDKEDHNARDNRRKRVVIQTKIGDHLRRAAF